MLVRASLSSIFRNDYKNLIWSGINFLLESNLIYSREVGFQLVKHVLRRPTCSTKMLTWKGHSAWGNIYSKVPIKQSYFGPKLQHVHALVNNVHFFYSVFIHKIGESPETVGQEFESSWLKAEKFMYSSLTTLKLFTRLVVEGVYVGRLFRDRTHWARK